MIVVYLVTLSHPRSIKKLKIPGLVPVDCESGLLLLSDEKLAPYSGLIMLENKTKGKLILKVCHHRSADIIR